MTTDVFKVMRLPIYQIDAFASDVFSGNPAAVVPLDAWLDDQTLLAIASENNLAETAYFVPAAGGQADYELRWFTPTTEVDLCGHATLASAYVISIFTSPGTREVSFSTRSGILHTRHEGEETFVIDLPALASEQIGDAAYHLDALADVLGPRAVELYRGANLMAVFDSEDDIRNATYRPDLERVLRKAEAWGLIITAPGRPDSGVDFVSRFFAPEKGVPEDPVTGSAHCLMMPYWVQRLGRQKLMARQLSRRGGELRCKLAGDRVVLTGSCVAYLEGVITI